MPKYIKIALGIMLLVLAVLLPAQALAETVAVEARDNFTHGLTILRACFALASVMLLVGILLPLDWFKSPGMPVAATGLRLGPDGWVGGYSRVAWRWLGIILAVGTVLRLAALNSDLWIDEIATVIGYLRRPVWENLYTYGSANQHLLYSVLGSISFSLFGESAWAARLPAALLGIGSLAGLYFLARIITSQREAILVTIFMTLSYHHVWFSQNARGYTGMLFCIVWGTAFFCYALAQNRTRYWVFFVVMMALGILFWQNMVFIFISYPCLYFLILPQWPNWRVEHWPLTRRVFVSGLFVAMLSLVGYSLVLPQIIAWYSNINQTGLSQLNLSDLWATLLQGLRSGFGLVGLVLGGVLVGSGWLSYWRQSRLVAGLLTLPLIFNAIVLIVLQIGAYPRYFLYVLPLALLVIVRGGMVIGNWVADHLLRVGQTQTFMRQHLGVGLVGVMLIGSAASLIYNYLYPKQDYTGALAYVMAAKAPEDVVSAVGLAGAGYREYYGNSTLHYTNTVPDLESLESEGHPVWVLYSFSRDMRARFPDIYDYVRENYVQVVSFPGTLEDGTMVVVKREGAPNG